MNKNKKNPPRFLYKYRNWTICYHSRILTHNEIFFSSPNRFNDPFDTGVHDIFRNYSDEKKKMRAKELLIEENPIITEKEIEEQMKFAYIERSSSYLDNIKRVSAKHRNQFGVFSTSAIKGNLLMWSHYSNAHCGFCVELDYELLLKFASNCYDRNQILFDTLPALYLQEYKDYDGTYEAYLDLIKTKADCWEYEDEYRCIMFTGCNESLILDDGIIKSVILGCEISQQDKEEIIKCLISREDKLNLYQARADQQKLALYFEPEAY